MQKYMNIKMNIKNDSTPPSTIVKNVQKLMNI